MVTRGRESKPDSAAATPWEVQLRIMVSPAGRRSHPGGGGPRGLTVRALVLDSLRAMNVPGLERGGDRRAAVAALKARLWREHEGNGGD